MQSNIRGPYGPWQRKARIFHTSGHGRLLPGYVWLVISRTPDEGGSKAHKFPMEELITWGIKGWWMCIKYGTRASHEVPEQPKEKGRTRKSSFRDSLTTNNKLRSLAH
ncbi:hypothetical protein CDAR_198261 [Caerostris darwini]|uniref:Uncharacterized protein n=1 Tax=Caerostris darwini TaxID=1538125 RepID=A0AAV4RRK8_9ARAC|nr:hypothetical protein CDAR_198261 [Caerostris darwini]